MSLNQIVNPLTDANFKTLKVNGSDVVSLNQITTPITDADFKTLKVNGIPIVSTPALQIYTPTITGTSINGFADISGSYEKNGKFLTMRCQFKANVVLTPMYVEVTVSLPPGETVKTGVPYQWGQGTGGPNAYADSIWTSSTKSSLPNSCSMFLSANKAPTNNGLFWWSIEFIIEVQ